MNAAIDQNDEVYIWGTLSDKIAKKSLCVKTPQSVKQFKASDVCVSSTMALFIEKTTNKLFTIGINASSELGLGDTDQRKSLVEVPLGSAQVSKEPMYGKENHFQDFGGEATLEGCLGVSQVAIGGSGFVVGVVKRGGELNRRRDQELEG